MRRSNLLILRTILFMLSFIMLFTLCGCAVFDGIFPSKADVDQLEEPAEKDAGFRRTVLYFETDDGMMVPVMKLLPWEEGIGKAALNQLVDTESNRISASSMGLKNVVPQGVSFVLSISDDAIATVNVIGLKDLASADDEKNLVTAVVNTLTEFPTIDAVEIKFDGKHKKKLKHGTSVEGVMSTQSLNMEPIPVTASKDDAQYKLTLYFPNKSASLQIPVTRTVNREPGLLATMQELVKGPADNTLRNCFPEGTEVLSASISDNVALVNLSKEFAELSKTPSLEQAAVESIKLTAKQFEDVATLKLQVEGSDYQAEAVDTMALPVFANEYR